MGWELRYLNRICVRQAKFAGIAKCPHVVICEHVSDGWRERYTTVGPNARGRYAAKPASGDDTYEWRPGWVNTISSVRIIQRQLMRFSVHYCRGQPHGYSQLMLLCRIMRRTDTVVDTHREEELIKGDLKGDVHCA